MRINKREKILLLVLVIAVLGYLFYNFIYLSNEEKIANLEAELEVKNTQVNELMQSIEESKNLNSKFKELNFEISDMSKIYLPDLDQGKLILFIDKKIDEYNIETSNISFTNDSVITINKEQSSNEAGYRYRLEELKDIYFNNIVDNQGGEENQEEQLSQSNADNLQINLNFNADYYDLLDFINDLQNNQFEITLSNLALTVGENNIIGGSMSMDFYSIPKLHEHDYMDWVWVDYIESGRSNPFYESDVQRDQYWTTRYDFVMNIKPISSDLPTVTLGEEDDIARDSYVYADSNSVESINIEVMQDGEMYYYKYRTSMESYPVNYEEEWIEFTPENDYISMQINSEPRSGADDQAGVELNIVNDTDIIFYINILNEDLINPRVEYEESGNVVFRVNE
jgi:type IV pilus assembly protein PilO